jgi:hypothetical protein
VGTAGFHVDLLDENNNVIVPDVLTAGKNYNRMELNLSQCWYGAERDFRGPYYPQLIILILTLQHLEPNILVFASIERTMTRTDVERGGVTGQ